jgi:hypothetical protein
MASETGHAALIAQGKTFFGNPPGVSHKANGSSPAGVRRPNIRTRHDQRVQPRQVHMRALPGRVRHLPGQAPGQRQGRAAPAQDH